MSSNTIQIFVVDGDARPDESEVRNQVPHTEHWRPIVYIPILPDDNPRAAIREAMSNHGAPYMTLVTTSASDDMASFFGNVLPQSHFDWLENARRALESSREMRKSLAMPSPTPTMYASMAYQLSSAAVYVGMLKDRGQKNMDPLIDEIHNELRSLVWEAAQH